VKKKLTPLEQAALKYGLECVSLRKGDKIETHCAAWPKRKLLRNLKGSFVGGVITHPGRFTPKGDEIFHETEPAKKPPRKMRSKQT